MDEQTPFFRPQIGEAELAAVRDVLTSGWLTSGPRAGEFESAFAAYVGCDHAVAVASGTAALLLSLEALGVGPGDEVLIPTLTFAAAAAVICQLGARPVLVDCLPDALTLDPVDLKRRITPRSHVIMPMHYGGRPCAMDPIIEIARGHGLAIVEDAAHALPAEYRGRRVGSIGEATCFSFYANKPITTGEGGMVTTNSADIARRVRLMAHHGLDRSVPTRTGARQSWRYDIVAPGYKANLSDIAAALGLRQLERCDAFQSARERCATRYAAALAGVPGVQAPSFDPDSRSAWHLYVVQIDSDALAIERDAVCERLASAGIASSVHYLPLHMHPYYRDALGHRPGDLPNATRAYDRMLSLPIFPDLADEAIDRAVLALGDILRTNRR